MVESSKCNSVHTSQGTRAEGRPVRGVLPRESGLSVDPGGEQADSYNYLTAGFELRTLIQLLSMM